MLLVRSWYNTDGTLTFYCAVLYLATLRKFVISYCSVEVFTIKLHPSAYSALLGKIDSPFCLQNSLAAYFAQNSASKFCQGLPILQAMNISMWFPWLSSVGLLSIHPSALHILSSYSFLVSISIYFNFTINVIDVSLSILLMCTIELVVTNRI